MKNKSIGALSFGLTFAGMFLGAGYVSGQELWQFFGSFGAIAPIGLIISISILCFLGIITIFLSKKLNTSDISRVVLPFKNKALDFIFEFFQMFFMFGVVVIMTAGASQMLLELFGINKIISSIIFGLLLIIVSTKGMEGMVKLFSMFVPVLVVATIVISIIVIQKNGIIINTKNSNTNVLMNNWLLSAILYVSFNFFGAISILTPFNSVKISNKKIIGGISFGGIMLFLLAIGILISISSLNNTGSFELPMMNVAKQINNTVGIIYGLLLLLGMFGTSVSCNFAVSNYLKLKSDIFNKKLTIIIITAFAVILSFFGFSNVISVVYPITGYLGIISAILLICNYFYEKRRNKND